MKKLSPGLLIIYPYVFAFSYFIILMFLETSTINAFQNKSFLFSGEYLKPYLLYSGGIIDYWGLFFTEILKFNLAGALMYSLLLLISILLYQRILVKIGVTKNLLLITMFPFIFIFLLTFNHFHPIAYNLKLIISLLFLNAILSLQKQSFIHKIFLTIIMVLLWYLVGMEFFVISLLHIIIISIMTRSDKKDVFVILLSVASVLLLNTYIFYSPFLFFKQDILTFESQIPFLLLLTYVILILTPIVAIIRLNISLHILWQFGIVLLIAIPLCRSSFDKVNHYMGKIMAAGNKGNYNEVLEIRDNTTVNTRLISAYTNMALLHKRTLLTSMFKYRQDGGIDGIFPSRDFDHFTAYINMKISYELGSINPAVRWAMEASSNMGYNTEILRHLILCHLINDNVIAAEKYHMILNKTLFHRKLKKELGNIISNYKNGNPDKIIIQKRNLRTTGGFYQNNGNKPANFQWALQTKNNHKALEFYTAVCLLNNEFHRMKDVIPKMVELGYKSIPIHVQEALCLFYAAGQTPPNLFGYKIDKNLMQDCMLFFQTQGQYNDNLFTSKDEQTQRKEYTYWYYLYNISPVNKKLTRIIHK